MTRIALLAVVLSACTGSTYYPSGQPVYAQQTTTQASADGTATQTTTTTFQSTSYEEPAPPPPPPAPEPAPAPVTGECDPRDNRDMCTALGVILDVGDILQGVENESCRRASKELNRYADSHGREIRVLMNLENTQTSIRLRQFQERHGATASVVMGRALDLEARCEDDRVTRALRRIGFKGVR